MICPDCETFQSGDTCKICSHVFKPKKEPKLLQRSKTPIKKESDRRRLQNIEYRKLRIQFLLENPQCAVYPHLKATTVHHQAGRIEDLLCDVSKWIPASALGHTYIELNPNWAKENNFSLERLKTTI
jgi:methionyl-tRNA synthetase